MIYTYGVLAETTTELATSLSLAASRWIVELDGFMRAGLYDGWLLYLFVGNLLKGQTVGVIGASRIVFAYARMMNEGFKMNLIYYDFYQATRLEKFVTAYGQFLKELVTWKHTSLMDEVNAFLDENSPPPSACPSIVNAKQLATVEAPHPTGDLRHHIYRIQRSKVSHYKRGLYTVSRGYIR
ncbi:unnamed protein product [Lactuca saligna]|uniref:D-isomer specific 2-hydroxyacid dehydrogenase NAD-binding domain-containing protein n=1 Tax=Lactuca saligna TaxID=75948 RepID=A0AA35ZBX3_LACSI|nr:unnamed protein product [Lactuca saligna]